MYFHYSYFSLNILNHFVPLKFRMFFLPHKSLLSGLFRELNRFSNGINLIDKDAILIY